MNEDRLEIKAMTNMNVIAESFQKATGTVLNFNKAVITTVSNLDELGNTSLKSRTIEQDGKVLKETFDDAGKTIKRTLTTVNKSTSISIQSIGKFLNKFYAFMNSTKFIRDAFKGMIANAVEFNETQNMFNVSMGTGRDEAILFVNKITEAVGVATKELMNYQTTYKNVLAGLGDFSDEQSEEISESLVKMALDYSSLFNVERDAAMNKFTAALTGSIRPIRSGSGYDVSEITIGEKARELGVEKTIGQLSQMEKRILRIIVLMDQMKNTAAFGDLARTIEEPANQIKVLQDQVQELGIWIGNVFMGTIGAVLPYINAFVMTLKELVKMFAMFVGWEASTSGMADVFEDVEDSAEGIAGGIGSANKSAKELKKTLMGFDVLNVITTPKNTAGGGGGGSSIDPAILNSLKQYDSLMENVRMKATDIRDKIMDWLGFTKVINPLTGEISWHFDKTNTYIDEIWNGIKAIGIVLAGWTIFKNWGKIKSALEYVRLIFSSAGLGYELGKLGTAIGGLFGAKTMTTITSIATGLGGLLGIIGSIVAAYKAWKWATEDCIKATDVLEGVSEKTVQRLKPVKDSFDELNKIVGNVSYDGLALTETEKEKIIQSIYDLTAQLSTALTAYVQEQVDILNKMYDGGMISEEQYNQQLEDLQAYQDQEAAKITQHTEELKQAALASFDERGNLKVKEYAEFTKMSTDYQTQELSSLAATEEDKQKILANSEENNLAIRAGSSAEAIRLAGETRDKSIEAADQEYKDTISALSKMKNLSDEERKEIVENAWNKRQEDIKNAEEYYDTQLTDFEESQKDIADYIDKDKGKVKAGWEKFWSDIGSFFKGIIDNISNWWNGLSFNDKSANINVSGPSGRGYATGGVPTMGEVFIAREAGPELVGKIGNSNAVMNNNQIVEAVSIGVAQAVSSVLGNRNSNAPIRLEIDGREIATVVRNNMNDLENVYGY